MSSVVLVHGIFNHLPGVPPAEAAVRKAEQCRPKLAAGLAAAGLDVPVPEVAMAYYADLLRDEAPERQSAVGGDRLESLTDQELAEVYEWLVAAGGPELPDTQNVGLKPVRQMLGWLVEERSGRAAGRIHEQTVQRLERLLVGQLREVEAYTSWPGRRRAVRERVAEAIRAGRPSVLVAHSLGSVVAYETLHAFPGLEVELLVTLGSPLRVPTVVRRLDPGLRSGRGARPAGVARWVNVADVGDLVAVPPGLSKAFPVDQDETTDVGLGFHGLGGYLSNGLTAAALAPYIS
ncbi:hypothetical protein [Peterkaempfera sp. SMS 1(5)a]|uniref:hypothetical protein n=1 Tax=Peterkaempfera podocarpi TaxID=3232308 RepID=UPI0036727F2B